MGFKDEVRGALDELSERVDALEQLAAQHLGARYDTRTPIRTATPAARTATTAATAARSTLDYAAVAFGLSEVKGKVAQLVPAGRESDMRSEWEGTVDYFADVFAKADPSFNRDEFNRLARR